MRMKGVNKMTDTRQRGMEYLKKTLLEQISPCIAVSKLYTPEESWTKDYAWWFDLPLDRIDTYLDRDYYLLCENKDEGFHILRIPNRFLKDNIDEFTIQDESVIRLHLGAAEDILFIDQRGSGKVDFSSFLVN